MKAFTTKEAILAMEIKMNKFEKATKLSYDFLVKQGFPAIRFTADGKHCLYKLCDDQGNDIGGCAARPFLLDVDSAFDRGGMFLTLPTDLIFPEYQDRKIRSFITKFLQLVHDSYESNDGNFVETFTKKLIEKLDTWNKQNPSVDTFVDYAKLGIHLKGE